MKYFISGLSEDQTNKVSMPMGTFSFSQSTRECHLSCLIFFRGLGVGTTLVEKTTGMKVLVHWPMSSFQGRGGAAYPQVVSNELQEPVQFATYYPLDARTIHTVEYERAKNGDEAPVVQAEPHSPVYMGITDFKNQEWGHVDFSITVIENALHNNVTYDHRRRKFMTNTGNKEAHVFLLRPQMVLMMNSKYKKTHMKYTLPSC